MNLRPNTVETGREEEPVVGGAQPVNINPNELKNYANDKALVPQLLDLAGILQQTRAARIPLHNAWGAQRRMLLFEHDAGRRYVGRSQQYIPVATRTIGTIASNLARGVFPSDEYMDVVDMQTGDPARARPVKQYMQWEMEKNAKLKPRMKPFFRQYALYGNAVLKLFYSKEIKSRGRLELRKNAMGGFRSAPSFGSASYQEGLCCSARSLYSWYMYPFNAMTLDEATVVFEDIDVPRSYIEEMIHKKVWENGDAALNIQAPSEHESERSTLYSDSAQMSPPSAMSNQGAGDIRTVTEVWCYLKLHRSAYFDDEDPNLPIPARVLFAGETPLRVTRNPMWHQKPPYLFIAKDQDPGFTYGSGYGKTIQGLQYMANDFANLTADNAQYCLNPIVKAVMSELTGPLKPISPGVVWGVLSPDAITFDRPPVELIGHGFQSMNAFIQMAQDFGGAPPSLQGSNSGGSANTATGMQILQRNALTPLQDEVEDIQEHIMVPALEMGYSLAQQYRESEVMAIVANYEPMKISPEQLSIQADFRWLAASQAVNSQQRAQGILQLIQSVMPLVPHIMQMGYVVDFVPLIQKYYSDGQGLRNFDAFIKPAQAMQGAQPGMMPNPQQMPGIGMEQESNARSALDQLGMGQQDMVPGEGDEFASVRDNADGLAGMMGGLM